jgi:predicted DNA-binding transcriptional regulator AlpA
MPSETLRIAAPDAPAPHPAGAVEPEPLAIDAADVGKLLGVSERHVWSMNSRGRLPRPIRLGRAVRWRVAELQAWLAAGCPERSRWEAMRD